MNDTMNQIGGPARAYAEGVRMVGWRLIDAAPLGVWGWVWNRGWRHAYPGMVNGPNGAVWVDTCEPEARGWQTHATHWMPELLPEEARP